MSSISEVISGIREYTKDTGEEVNYELLHQGVYVIEDFVSIVLGLVISIMVLSVGIMLALDMMYLTNPTLSYYTDTKKYRVLNVLVSNTAKESKKQGQVTGQSAIWIYLKKEIVYLMCLGVTLFILFGNFSVVVQIISAAVEKFVTTMDWKIQNPSQSITEVTTSVIRLPHKL